jgi:hypothetical protein
LTQAWETKLTKQIYCSDQMLIFHLLNLFEAIHEPKWPKHLDPQCFETQATAAETAAQCAGSHAEPTSPGSTGSREPRFAPAVAKLMKVECMLHIVAPFSFYPEGLDEEMYFGGMSNQPNSNCCIY